MAKKDYSQFDSFICYKQQTDLTLFKPGSTEEYSFFQDSLSKTDLQTKVLQWDEKLPIPDPPPLSRLVEHLLRRRLTSNAKGFKVALNKFLVRASSRALGFQGAHER